MVRFLLFFFFFSSRRRHTRSLCDWSSDVALPIWQLLGIFAKRKQASSFSFHRWAEGLALRDVGLTRRRSGVSKASPRCFRAKWHRSASRSPSLNPVAFAQTSRAVPPNLAKVIPNTIRRLELPQDFSGTITASSLVTPKRQLRRSSS